MTTASTNTTFSNNSNATFQAWVNEIYTGLVTSCGLTQTADTGQMAVPCVTAIPAANTNGGYYIFRFNDTLQATSPIFIRMDFGSGFSITGTGVPSLQLTVGTSTNGAGTITGTALALSQCLITNQGPAGGGATNYVTRFCYNATQGFLGMVFKINMLGGTAGSAWGGFYLFRSVDNTGAPTATAANFFCLSYNSTSASGSQQGQYACLDFTTSTVYFAGSTAWGFIPFQATSTVVGTTAQVFPVFAYQQTAALPGTAITNQACIAINADVALHASFSATLIGALSLTYINVGAWPGNSITNQGYAPSGYGFCMLWQ